MITRYLYYSLLTTAMGLLLLHYGLMSMDDVKLALFSRVIDRIDVQAQYKNRPNKFSAAFTEMEVRDTYQAMQQRQREMRLEMDYQQWKAKSQMRELRAKQRENRLRFTEQKDLAKRVRKEQSQIIKDIKAKHQDLINSQESVKSN